MKYYHLSYIENRGSIVKSGLKANDDGEIFVITKKDIAPYIAANQIFTRTYDIYSIDSKGVTGEVTADNVAELTAPHQRIIKQEVIDPKHIKWLGTYDLV